MIFVSDNSKATVEKSRRGTHECAPRRISEHVYLARAGRGRPARSRGTAPLRFYEINQDTTRRSAASCVYTGLKLRSQLSVSAWRCASCRLTLILAGLGSAFGQTPATLNLSRDLVTYGISGQNMAPDTPSLDARPLFEAGKCF